MIKARTFNFQHFDSLFIFRSPNTDTWQMMTNIPAWQTFDDSSQKYLEFSFNMTSDSLKSHFEAEQLAFWTDVVPTLGPCAKCTCPEPPEPEVELETPQAGSQSEKRNAASLFQAESSHLLAFLILLYTISK